MSISTKLKRLLLLLLVSIGSLAGYAQQNQRVTIAVQNATLKQVFRAIEQQTAYRFSYKDGIIDDRADVSISQQNAAVETILDAAFANRELTYTVVSPKSIVIAQKQAAKAEKAGSVAGQVVDVNGEPIIGANIVIKGTTQGTITDLDGNFEIQASPRDVLVVSYIGYDSKEVAVKGQKRFEITLQEDTEMLDDVVVVGYGQMKKSDLTGSTISISSKNIVDSHKQSAVGAIQGTVAGVDIIKNGSRPGAGFNIMVRGQNTIATTNDHSSGGMDGINPPLYIVDGIMLSSIDDIAPDDIERIDVLKDASSTAIYGSRGANGVVLVTTKKGTEGRSMVEYNGFVSMSKAYNLPDMLTGQEWAQYKVNRYKGSNWTKYMNGESDPTVESVLTTQQYRNYMAGKSVDWLDEMLQTGWSHNHSVRAYGSAKGLVYSFSMGYTDESGVTGADSYKRYNFSSSVDKTVNSRIKVGSNIYVTYSKLNNSGQAIRQAFRMNPLADMYEEDGTTLKFFPDDGLVNVTNPLTERNEYSTQTRTLHAFGNIYLQFEPIKGLTLKTTFSPDASFERYGMYGGRNSATGRGQTARATADNNWENTLSSTWTNQIQYERTFKTIHRINAMVGTEWRLSHSDDLDTEKKGYASDAYRWYNMAAGSTYSKLASSYTQDQWMSYFTRLNYSLRDRYMLTVTGRYDGSSRLAEGNRWKFFPSAALAWRASEEEFLKNVGWLDNLKVRLSYGLSGNNANVDPYSTTSNVSNYFYQFGTGLATATTIDNLENSSLTWETTKELNFGLDFGFLHSRINGTVDIYHRRTEDILMNRVMSRINGYDSAMDNVGVVDNNGIELGLNIVPVRTRDFTWNIAINFTRNKNEIKELSDGSDRDEANGWFVGESVGAIWQYKAIGYWGMNEIDQAAKAGGVPGSVRVEDVDGDGVPTNADKQIIGDRFPKWTAGITSTWTYKNWSLAVQAFTRQGQTSWSEFHWTAALDDNANFGHMNLNYWTPETASSANWPRAGQTNAGTDNLYYSIMYQKTDYWKIGHITLGYDVPKQAMEKLKLSKCHFYLSCQNPFMFTDYKGLNPEDAAKGSDQYYFLTRSFELGVNLSF